MNGYTRKIGGTCAGLVATGLALQEPFSKEKLIVAGMVVAGSMIGSLNPDIDHKNSTISKKHKIISWIMRHIFEHRGFTHAPIIQAVIIFAMLYWGRNFGGTIGYSYLGFVVGLGVGIFSHIFLDWLTVAGVPLFYPFTKKKFHLLELKTNKHSGGTAVVIIFATVVVLSVRVFLVLNGMS
jgi:inner membrane protein